jgi:TPR repeat protein
MLESRTPMHLLPRHSLYLNSYLREEAPKSHFFRSLRSDVELGRADSQNDLGLLYAKGFGVPKDYVEAVNLFLRAAEQGHADAQFNLGVMNAEGLGVQVDFALAMKWFRKAAEQGAFAAQSNLGFMYANGDGVEKDITEAYAWLNLAGSKGDETSRKNLGTLENGMTPAAILEGQKRTQELIKEIQDKRKKGA